MSYEMMAKIWDAMDRDPGAHPLETLPEPWVNAKVTFQHQNGAYDHRFEIIDTTSGNRYLQEPMYLIAFKCFMLFSLVLPAYYILYNFLHLIRIPTVTILNLSLIDFVKQVWTVIRAPFFYIALECAAIYGTFKPLEGRALFAEIESAWHDNKNRRESENYQKDRPFLNIIWEFLSQKEHSTALFIGFCMQPVGTVQDLHIINVERLNPQRA